MLDYLLKFESLYLSVCIEDFDPLRGHEQINLSCGRSLTVGALHNKTHPKVNRRSHRLQSRAAVIGAENRN